MPILSRDVLMQKIAQGSDPEFIKQEHDRLYGGSLSSAELEAELVRLSNIYGDNGPTPLPPANGAAPQAKGADGAFSGVQRGPVIDYAPDYWNSLTKEQQQALGGGPGGTAHAPADAPAPKRQWVVDAEGNPLAMWEPGKGWMAGQNWSHKVKGGDMLSRGSLQEDSNADYKKRVKALLDAGKGYELGSIGGSKDPYFRNFDPKDLDLTGLNPKLKEFFNPDSNWGNAGYNVWGSATDPTVGKPRPIYKKAQKEGSFGQEVMKALAGGDDAPVPGWGPGVFFAGAAAAGAAAAGGAAAGGGAGAAVGGVEGGSVAGLGSTAGGGAFGSTVGSGVGTAGAGVGSGGAFLGDLPIDPAIGGTWTGAPEFGGQMPDWLDTLYNGAGDVDWSAFGNAGDVAGSTGGAFDPNSLGSWDTVNSGYNYEDFLREIGIDPASQQFSGGTMTNAEIMQSINADPSLIQQLQDKLSQLPPGSKEAAKGMISKLLSGDMSGLADLAKLGIPLALAAGVFEKPSSPLTGTLTTAANNAVGAVDKFGAMTPVGMQPSQQKAIDLANANSGAWKPYVDKAATYTSEAAGGVPSVDLSQYMNPYLRGVLDPQIRDIEEAAARRREALKATVSRSGNDFRTPGTNRFNVEDDLLDRSTLRSISDASGAAHKGAFDAATGLATTDLNRKGSAGGAFNTMANTVGTQNAGDFKLLGGAGELEAKPAENALTHAADTAKLYTSVIPGTTSAVTATKSPSVLGQAVGAFGAYNTANKMGMFDPPP